MAVITFLTRNRSIDQAARHALGEEHVVLPVATWARLTWTLRESAATCALVDGTALPRTEPERALIELARLYPSMATVLIATERMSPGILFRLGKAGVSGLVLLPVDGMVRDLPGAIRKSLHRSTASTVLRVVSPSLRRREQEAVRWALEGAQRGWRAEEIARRVGFTRPHLSAGLRDYGMPSPGHLLVWARLLHAGSWLADPGRTAESVSRQLGYSSGAAFRRALKNYVGAIPTAVSAGGGLAVVLERFVEACDLQIRFRALGSVA